MNYIKTFDVLEKDLEPVINAFFKELDEKNHRIMNAKYHVYKNASDEYCVWTVITVNDSLHPHKGHHQNIESLDS